jgi:glycosyltransferase involved in cell wall biosynthesis
MIVKNESNIILRLLNSVKDIVDSYCIVDTGSTDNTVDILNNYFLTNNLNYKIIQEPFKNFEYNRNHALKQCKNMADYILLLDADLIINKFSIDKESLNKSHYYLFQGTESFYYTNVRLIKNDIDLFKYVGLTHEVLICNDDNLSPSIIPINEVFIYDYSDGGSKEDKYSRDIKLLHISISNDPTDSRSYFYLANSYFDIGDIQEAIIWYLKRIELNGWEEEVWYSYYRIGLSYKILDDNTQFMMNMLIAYDINPNRLENIYEIILYFRTLEKYRIANLFYDKINYILKNKKYNINSLFFHSDVYEYKLLYEYLIIAYYNNIEDLTVEINDLLNSNIPLNMVGNVFNNIKYYIKNKYIVDDINDSSILKIDNQLKIDTLVNLKNKIFKYVTNNTNGFIYIKNIYYILTMSINNNPNKYLFLLKCDKNNKIINYSSIFHTFNNCDLFNSFIIYNENMITNCISFNWSKILSQINWFNI